MNEFKSKAHDQLALDGSDALIYLAPTKINLNLAQERYPNIQFLATREH
jgi:peptide chain release factor 3